MPGGTPAKETVAKDSTSAQTSPKTGETGAKSTPAPKPAATAEPTPAKPSTSKSPPAGQGSRQPGAGGSGPTPGHSSTTADPAQDGKVTWIADKAVKKSEWRTQTGRGSRKKAKRGLPSIADQLTSGGFPAHPAQAKKDLGKRFPKGPLFNEAEWNAFEQLSSTPQGQRWLNASGMLTLDQVKQYLSDDKDDNPEKFRGFHQLHKPSKVVLASYVSRQRNSGEGGQRFEGTPPAAVALSMEARHASDPARRDELKQEIDRGIAAEWAKTLEHTAPNDDATKAIAQGAVPNPTGSGTLSNDDVLDRYNQSIEVLTNVFHLLQEGAEIYDASAKSHVPLRDVPVAKLLSHGGRVNIQIPAGTPPYAVTELLGITDGHGNPTAGVFPRAFGTHHIALGKGKFKEEGGHVAAIKSKLDDTELYGMNLAIGGLGLKDFNGDVILPDGAHGHIFIGHRPPRSDRPGALQIGIETTGPNAPSTVGYIHNWRSTEKTANPISSVGGLKQDKIGDDQIKNARTVDLGKLGDDWAGVLKDRADRFEHDLAERGKDAIGELVGPRTLPPEDIQDTEQRASEQRSGGPDQEPRDDEPRDPPGDRASSPKEDAQDTEQRAPEQPTRGAEQTSQDNEPRELPGGAPEQMTAKAPEASSPQPGALPTQGAQEKAPERPGQPRPETAPQPPAGRPVDPTAITTGMQAPAPATSGSAQDQAASVTGMPPDETPAPSSARKRTAALAHSDDEQDAPASSKRAKNSGQSLSSSQAAQSAPERSGAGLLASRHIKALHDLMQMSDMSPEGLTMRGITGGGAFTSKRGNDGELSTDLRPDELDTLRHKVDDFSRVAQDLLTRTQNLPQEALTLYRVINDLDTSSLSEGDTIDEILPSSTSWTSELALDQWVKDGGLVMKINTTSHYPTVMFSYPDEQRDGDPIAYNQAQKEVLLVPSRMTITRVSDREHNGKRFREVEVTPRELESGELDDVFQRASQRIEEKQNAKPKEKSFEVEDRAAIAEQFGDTVADEILGHVDNLPHSGEIVVHDKDGTPWRIVSADSRFGIDLQEKKATPADAAAGNADTVTGAPAPSWLHAPPQGDGAATSNVDDAASANAGTMTSAPTMPQAGDVATKQLGGAPSAANQGAAATGGPAPGKTAASTATDGLAATDSSPTNDGKASIDATLEALNEKSARWSHPATDDNKQEAAALLGELMRAQDVDGSLIQRLEELIKNPDSLSQSQFAICALNGVLHALLTSDLSGFARVVAAEFSGKLFDRKGKLLADFSLPAQGEDGAATSSKVADPIQRVIRGEIPLDQAPIGNKLLRNGIKKAGAKRADVERKGSAFSDKHVLDYLLARGMGKMLSKLAPEQYKADAENTARAIPGYLDKAATRPKDATGPSKKRGDLLLSANSLVTLFNDILGGDARTMVAGNDYDVGRINDVLSRPDQAPFALATVLDGKALAERAAEFAKDPKKSRPFEDAGTFDASSTHQVVINGKITDSGTHYTVPIYSWGQTFSIDVKKEVMPKLFTVVTYGSFAAAQGQAQAPATSGTAQDQAASVTGMLPDETPAPDSATKRKAAQALSDDEQGPGSSAENKKAKNAGQPSSSSSSSSSSQAAQPAPARSGTGLLASRHIDALHDLMRDMSNTTPEAQTMRGIPGGGAFTSKRGEDGELSTDLRPDELDTLRQKVDDFSRVAQDLLTRTQDLPQEALTLYRVINDLDTSSLSEGDTIDEILPSSTSWTSDLALDQWVKDGGLVMKINTTSHYPTVMFSYPDQQRDGEPIAYNQAQKEVLLVPSRMTITRVTDREHNGKRFREVEVTPTQLPPRELDAVFERASERIEEKLNAKPKEKSFEVKDRAAIAKQFGDAVANEILDYVDKLPDRSEREIVVRDKDGTPWRIASADSMFGIDLEEKKATSAGRSVDPTAVTTGMQAPAPATSGSAQDQAASATGMPPDETPAPASARKRTAEQAQSDDEQDAPASSKRAKNSGQPSSSSSSQQAPPAPGRALASRHIDALQGLMRDMSNTSPQAQTMRGIPGGGAFTSKRGTDGELSTDLRPDELDTLRQKVDDFSSVARDLLTRTQDQPQEELTFYRVINDLDTSSLVEGGTLDELLPSSTSWTSDLALNQWVQDGGLVMKINTNSHYPTVMFSYPDAQRPGDVIAYNQDQKEVLLVPSRMTITKVTPQEHNGKRFLEIEVTPRELGSNELDDVFERASRRIEEKLNARPKEVSFGVDQRPKIVERFGDTVADEILGYVGNLPHPSEGEIVVRDKDGTPWRIVSADKDFGIDLQEKKAMPADAAGSSAATVTGAPAPSPTRPPAQGDGASTDHAGALATVTGMAPIQDPAPASARKRTAAQAQSDDEHDAPASSKRAKNTGEPSSSSSSQAAQPAPGRALASRHMDALQGLMRDMSNTSPQAQTMRGIPGGGAFTSKRGTDGELSTELRPDELTTLRQKVDDFSSVARDLLTRTQDLPQEELTFYRVINDLDTSSLVEGGTLDELLPSSTSWTPDLALNQWVQDGGLVMKINTNSHYPTVMFSYPDAQRPGDAIAYNQAQKEVLLVPSRMTITKVTPREHNGKRFLEVEVTPRELESDELDDVFQRASERIEERLNAKPKVKSFDADDRAAIAEQFGDAVADEILRHVDKLPDRSEREIVVRDKEGTRWRIVSADERFGIDLQEKKATPADVAESSAEAVTGAPAPSAVHADAQVDSASTDNAGALANVTGMAPIQDPAPASARKRTAAQAHSDDEQDAPASSKRAKNAGEQSSSSSSQQAPPAPGRALASRHIDALQGLMRDMSNTSPQAQTMRGIPGGGAFTSKRGTDGELSTELRPDELTTLRQKVDDFSSVARDLLTRTQDLPQEDLTFYRVINDLDTSSLVEGGTLDELLPSSTSWTSDLALNQWVQDGGLVMKINTTSKYPTVMFSYPDQQRDGEPIAYNQDQKEVLLVPSRMTITKVTPREHNGKRFLEVEVTPRELESNELDDVFQRASQRIEERLNAKPKEVSFEVDERPEIVEQFGDAVADEILRYVGNLPDPSEREIVVRDNDGTPWRIVSADERFGIDLQEKKATPADVAGSSAEAVTGASPGRPATELGRRATGQTPNGPAPGDPRASTTKDGLAATQSPPAADGNASVDAAIKALNEKSAQWSHPATGANKQEAKRLLGDLMRSQGVDEALVERLAELIENPSSLSQSQFAICALNSALHTLLTSDLGGFARVVAAEFTGKLFDRQGDLLADFSLPAQGENGAAVSAQVADPIHRVLRGELPVQNAGFGNKLLLNGIKKAKAGSADRERKGSAFSGEHVLDYLLARGMGKMLSKLAPEQYKDDAENAAGVIPGYLDKTTPRAKDATGPSKKHGDLLLSANSLVTLFNKILGGDAKTMVAGADYDVGRINDVLARPDQAPFALATILDGKALAERAKEFAKDPTKSRPFEDARAIDTSSTHQVVINGKITEDGDHYVVPLHTWQQSFSIKVKKDVLPSLFPVFTYGTYLPSRAPAANDLTLSQAPMPAASGSAQDQAANVAGMLPDETPAPSSARKRAAEQAQSDDEHDAPASSKRAKNTGEPSSSSSSQAAQPAPGRALASRHMDALHGLMRDMSNTSSEAQTMRGIPGGGAFTSKRGTDGELSTELRPDELTTLRQKVDDFSSVARDLLTRTQDLPQEDLTFYRVINDLDTSSLVEGGTLDELLPSSTSWTPDLALNQWVQDGGLLMKINTTSKYPTVMFSYPDAQRPGDAIAYNQDQKEVLLVPSRMTITKVTPREHNGKRFLEVEVTPRELESDELDDVFQRASQRIEERLNAKPKVKSFDADDRAAIAEQFGDAVADEILRHVDKLPDRSEREIVVRDKDGTPWRIASADSMFGIDLEEKKATPAGRPVDPAAITTGMQAPAPAASGSAQDQDASATGMPPDETPAPSSARKRTAAQAQSEDEQDAPASSKRAKNSGQPSSSPQPAQPAPERSGTGLLASRHIDALQGLMRNMSNTTPEAQTMRGIPGGGAFTSKRGEDGELSTDLRPDELDTLRQKIDDFSRVAQDLLTATQDLNEEDITLYRVINDLDTSALSEGGTLDEILPSSTSWTPDLALNQWVKDGGLVMKINTTSHYPTVMFSYPDQQRDGDPIAYNQDQKEVLLVPSRMTITRVTDREHNGKRFREVEVTPTQLPPRELDAVFERASERIKEKQNTKPKEKHFELDEQSDIAAQFGDIVTDEILRHVDKLPDPSEREIVVRDKDGTRWRLVSADSMFGIDLQEKKATPADVPTGYNPALDGEDDAGDLQPPAPSSARKRTAAQAQSEDEQDAPASSKRAKNSGQPSSSSSSQAAQSPPERSGTGLLASRHIKALHDLMQMSDTSPEGLTMRGITGGGAFTSKRGEDGELRADLRLDELATLRPKVDDFSRVAQDLLTRTQDLPREDLTLYRVINDLDTSSLSEGGTIDEILPSSTSWTSELALDQWVKDGGLVMKINTTSHYPTVMFSYPDQQRDEDPIAYNQAQKEVLLVPSRMTITRVSDREHNGKRFREIEVTPTRLPKHDLDAAFERASERIKEKQNTKPKEVSFQVDQRPKIVEQFGETAADEILGHVDNLPYSEEIVVRDKAGTPWRIVSADSGFGIDLQEKKATPADAAAGSADTVTGAPAPSWTHAPPQGDGAATTKQLGGAPSTANQGAALTGSAAPGKTAASTTTTGGLAATQSTPTNDGKASIDATLEALNEKSAQWSHPATDDNKQEAAALLGELMRAQGVDESLIERLAELIENPGSLSQSQFAICALNGVLHALLTSDLSGFARVVAAEFSGKLFDREGKLRADFSLPAQGEDGAATSPKIADPIQRVIRGEIPLEQAPIGNKLLQNGIKKAGAKRADVERKGGAFSDKHVLDYLLARGMGKMLSKLAPEQYKADAENTARAIPGYLDKAATRPKDATGPSKKRGDLLLSANSLVTLFNDILGGDARTMVAGNDYDVGRINDVLSRPDQAPFALATVLDGKALAERAKEFAKDPTKSRPFEDAGTFDASSTHQVVINGKITDSGTHYTVPIYSWGQTFSIDVKKEVMPKLFTVVTYGSFSTAQGQTTAPATSGSAQDQAASVTGMLPDETPAPDSATKRKAALALGDDEQDAPASSKRAKNSGQPSSSPQPAQPAPERSGTGLLASRHIDALQGLMRNMSNTTPEAQTMRGIPGGGAFTSKRGEDGELSTDLRPDELDTLRQKIDDFSRVAQDLLTATQDLNEEDITLYRVINDLDTSALSEGGTLDEILPSSTSWTPDLALNQWVKDGGLVMKINTTSHYPTVMFSYPDQQRDGDPIAYNQDQKEVLLVPSRMTITRVTDREHNGKRFREVEVTPTALPPHELDAVFERASERIKEKLNAKPKEVSFEVGQRPKIVEQFGETAADEILGYVDDLPYSEEIVVRDKAGTAWRVVSADSGFGIDLQEKKVTPADAAGSAGTATAGTGTPPAASAASPSAITTGFNPAASVSRNAPEDMLAGYNASNSRDHAAAPTAATTSGSPSSAEQAAQPQGSPLEDLIRTIEEQSGTWPRPADGEHREEAAQLLSQLLHAQSVRGSVVERLSTLIKDPASLSQSAFTNCALHSVLYTTLKNDLATASHLVVALFTGRPLGRLAGAPGAGTFGQQGSRSRALSHGLELLLSQMKGEVLPAHGPTPNRPLLNGLKTAKAKRDRLKGQGAATQELDGHLLDHLLARGLVELLGETAVAVLEKQTDDAKEPGVAAAQGDLLVSARSTAALMNDALGANAKLMTSDSPGGYDVARINEALATPDQAGFALATVMNGKALWEQAAKHEAAASAPQDPETIPRLGEVDASSPHLVAIDGPITVHGDSFIVPIQSWGRAFPVRVAKQDMPKLFAAFAYGTYPPSRTPQTGASAEVNSQAPGGADDALTGMAPRVQDFDSRADWRRFNEGVRPWLGEIHRIRQPHDLRGAIDVLSPEAARLLLRLYDDHPQTARVELRRLGRFSMNDTRRLNEVLERLSESEPSDTELMEVELLSELEAVEQARSEGEASDAESLDLDQLHALHDQLDAWESAQDEFNQWARAQLDGDPSEPEDAGSERSESGDSDAGRSEPARLARANVQGMNQLHHAGKVHYSFNVPSARLDALTAVARNAGVQEELADARTGFLNPDHFEKQSSFTWRLKPGVSASKALREFFDPEEHLTIAECGTTMQAINYRTLLRAVGDEDFDRRFGGEGSSVSNEDRLMLQRDFSAQNPLQRFFAPEAATLDDEERAEMTGDGEADTRNAPSSRPAKRGGWYYIKNHELYVRRHPEGFWSGENAMYLGRAGASGKQMFSGFGVPPTTEEQLAESLASEFNHAPSETEVEKILSSRRDLSLALPTLGDLDSIAAMPLTDASMDHIAMLHDYPDIDAAPREAGEHGPEDVARRLFRETLEGRPLQQPLSPSDLVATLNLSELDGRAFQSWDPGPAERSLGTWGVRAMPSAAGAAASQGAQAGSPGTSRAVLRWTRPPSSRHAGQHTTPYTLVFDGYCKRFNFTFTPALMNLFLELNRDRMTPVNPREQTVRKTTKIRVDEGTEFIFPLPSEVNKLAKVPGGFQSIGGKVLSAEQIRREFGREELFSGPPSPVSPGPERPTAARTNPADVGAGYRPQDAASGRSDGPQIATAASTTRGEGSQSGGAIGDTPAPQATGAPAALDGAETILAPIDALVRRLVAKSDTWSSPRTQADKQEAIALVTELLQQLGMDARVVDRAGEQGKDTPDSEHSACTCVR
ncbi:hypothetical protein [Sorangium sp. So ce363]|uniref:hypothetical protein n=1 Tax=Sorangium sp. So ce363 TaxID=3133304 RepID=UPI003F5F382F